jgi:hypothetical protein
MSPLCDDKMSRITKMLCHIQNRTTNNLPVEMSEYFKTKALCFFSPLKFKRNT